MNKRYAWTLAELMLALIFIMVIAGFLMTSFKPNQQNAKIKAYAAIRNIEKGVISVSDYYSKMAANTVANQQNGPTGVAIRRTIFYKDSTIDTAGNDTFCMILADTFALKQSANCTKVALGTASTTPNLVFPNGVEVYGVSSEPFSFFSGDTNFETKAAYKNIMVDVDGMAKGRNKIGIDRFPLRIYSLENIVLPVNCNETQLYDWRKEAVELAGSGLVTLTEQQKNPYCKTGKQFNGTRSKQDFWLDTETISFDTFRNEIKKRENGDNSTNVEQNNEPIAFTRSLAETLCGVFGGKKFLSVSQCASYGFKIFTKCPSEEACLTCGSICPMDLAGTAQTTQGESGSCMSLYKSLNNKQNFCYYGLHRPSAGMSAVVSGIIGSELDME